MPAGRALASSGSQDSASQLLRQRDELAVVEPVFECPTRCFPDAESIAICTSTEGLPVATCWTEAYSLESYRVFSFEKAGDPMKTYRDLAVFNLGVQATLLVEYTLRWLRGSPFDWSLSLPILGMMLLGWQQLLAESSHKTRLLITCVGTGLIVSSITVSIWTHYS
jgi:hypothetical protein